MSSSKSKQKDISVNNVVNVLLDLDGTCDHIDFDFARIFVIQLDKIRRKFKADFGLINISTHYNNPDKIKDVLDLIKPNLTNTIKIGVSFYYGGIYDYNTDSIQEKEGDFNTDKIETFKNYYLNNTFYNNKFIAIFDDMIFSEVYMEYKDNYPIFVCRPSQIVVNPLENNFMSYSTTTTGFYGVVEGFDKYIDSIKDMTYDEILNKQKNFSYYISQHEIINKIINKDYEFIETNFKNINFSTSDYFNMIYLFINLNSDKHLDEEDIYHLNNILQLVINNSVLETEEDKETFKKLKKIINKD